MMHEILGLINSQDVADRKTAIDLLKQQGGEEAMHYLALLYKFDPDAEVQRLAVQAGRYLKSLHQPQTPAVVTTQEVRAIFAADTQDDGDSTAPAIPAADARRTQTATGPLIVHKAPPADSKKTDTATQPVAKKTDTATQPAVAKKTQPLLAALRKKTEPLPEAAPTVADIPVFDTPEEYYEVDVPYQDVDRSYGFLEAAWLLYEQQKPKQAIVNLRRALELNPNLCFDDTFREKSQHITGQPTQRHAIDFLLNPPEKRAAEEEAARRAAAARGQFRRLLDRLVK
ncbi:MAG: hypothetical protein MUE40_03660 [Anaerolineae bacterium]|jgi:tetratricopeptide (TPR) repeat protein|nr:hypothetical protein [Anaerolineae bacterium]